MTGPAFVTGGSGFVGGGIVRRLVADGRTVRALARTEAAAAAVRDAGAVPVRGDVFDTTALLEGMRDCDTVFHAAGVSTLCPRDPDEMLRVNVEGSASVVSAAAAAGVGRVVHTSSAAAIGEPPGVIGDERTRHRGWFLTQYERSKHLAERRALELAAELGLHVVFVSPSSVQGPGRTTGTARLLIRLANARVAPIVDTHVSIVDIADCSEAHALAAARGVPGERYLVSGATVSTREAAELVRGVVGRPRTIVRVPRGALTLAATVGDVVARTTGAALPLCRESARALLHGHRYDGSYITRALGLRYTPVDETIRRTLVWYAGRGLTPPVLGTRFDERGVG